MSGGRRVGTWGLVCMGALSSVTLASAPVFADSPAIDPPRIVVSLADNETNQRWFSVVPSDSPVLLPMKYVSSTGAGYDVSGLDSSYTHVTVAGDPDGKVTGFKWKNGSGRAWSWTPAVRELGRTYTAHLAAGPARLNGTQLLLAQYGDSTFTFTYVDATSAMFLPTVELAVLEYGPEYHPVGTKCCAVVASECEGASCHQCWDTEGSVSVSGKWDGPGLAYLTLSDRPDLDNLVYDNSSDIYLITENREFCIEGTATASGETVTVEACGMPTAPPVHQATGVQTVFAESCEVLPPGTHPTTLLVAARAGTEAEAREQLEQQHPPPPPLPESSDASRCAISRRPPARSETGLAFWCLSFSLIATIAWRRRRPSPDQRG
ncbi:MAG TPA: hypothetical protein VER96_39140 [Polyangiaceae bacterium]|nr:hypothetical protein [Polyangiaceae bacterium]